MSGVDCSLLQKHLNQLLLWSRKTNYHLMCLNAVYYTSLTTVPFQWILQFLAKPLQRPGRYFFHWSLSLKTLPYGLFSCLPPTRFITCGCFSIINSCWSEEVTLCVRSQLIYCSQVWQPWFGLLALELVQWQGYNFSSNYSIVLILPQNHFYLCTL